GRRFPTTFVYTRERPPQATLILNEKAIQPRPGLTKILITVRPVTPPARPRIGVLDGNVYRVAISGNNGAPVTLSSAGVTVVQLRGTGSRGKPMLERYTGGGWEALATTHNPTS